MKQANPYQFHAPTDAQKAAMQRLRDKCQELDALIREVTPPCRQQSLAITGLEEVSMWANKAANQRDD